MELRWYGRILQRQSRVIWTSFVLVAVLSALFTVYSSYGGRYKSTSTIEFYQKPPNIGGNTQAQDPHKLALDTAAQTTGNAKFYTQLPVFFKAVSRQLKSYYGKTMDWKAIQAGLGANIPNGYQLELEYTSADQALAEHIVASSLAVLENVFLPQYNATSIQPGRNGAFVTYPVQVRILDPISTRTPSLSSTVIGWISKSLLGIVLGLALAFLWEYLDESIHDEQDVRSWMATPTLGVIPGGRLRSA